MSKYIRLQLHVETELLGTRITPAARRRDPKLAEKPLPRAILTEAQEDVWHHLFQNAPLSGVYLEGVRWTAHDVRRVAEVSLESWSLRTGDHVEVTTPVRHHRYRVEIKIRRKTPKKCIPGNTSNGS